MRFTRSIRGHEDRRIRSTRGLFCLSPRRPLERKSKAYWRVVVFNSAVADSFTAHYNRLTPLDASTALEPGPTDMQPVPDLLYVSGVSGRNYCSNSWTGERHWQRACASGGHALCEPRLPVSLWGKFANPNNTGRTSGFFITRLKAASQLSAKLRRSLPHRAVSAGDGYR